MQTIGITGGTGFIGRHLTALLVSKGYKVMIFTRSPKVSDNDKITYIRWDVDNQQCDTAPLKELDAVVNLAGEGIADKRLTQKRKQQIIDSRVKSTEFLLALLKQHAPACKTLVAASATGYYGPDRGNAAFTENAAPYTDFLAKTCRLWEEASLEGTSFLRTVIIRIGIVLGKEGGAYPRLAAPLSFGIMPILGGGRQVVSWIAVDDLARLFVYALEHSEMSGVYNGVAPSPVTHRQLMQAIAKARGGIAIPMPVPAFILRLALGEMGEEVLKSCKVSAEKILVTGFTFDFPIVEKALRHIRE